MDTIKPEETRSRLALKVRAPDSRREVQYHVVSTPGDHPAARIVVSNHRGEIVENLVLTYGEIEAILDMRALLTRKPGELAEILIRRDRANREHGQEFLVPTIVQS